VTDIIDPNQSLRDKLTALRAKTEQTPEQEEARRLKLEIAAEEKKARALELEELEDRMSAEHPGGPVEGKDLDDAGIWVVRGPSRASWLLQEPKIKAGKNNSTDDTNFVLEALLYPDPKAADTRAKLDQFPLIVTSLADIITRLGGFNLEKRAKRGK
jgi:hypothetical protein